MLPQATAETFGERRRQRRGLLQQPSQSAGKPALVMCPPFGEERKAAARVMALAAAGLAQRGYPVLRFDYYGTGESDGSMEQVALTDWEEDLHLAARHLVERTGANRIGLVGLRFGATLAAWCGTDLSPLDCLVLWAPQMTGAETIADCRQHLAATRLLAGAGSPVAAGETIDRSARDMGGFLLSESLQGQIEAIRLPAATGAKARRVIVVQFSRRPEVSPTCQGLCEALTATGGDSRAFCLPVRPFWVTASRCDPRDVVERTVLELEASDAPAAAGKGASG